MNDQAVVAAQIDRSLRAEVSVESRCLLGLPVVAAVPPLLDDGTPFPTRFWLTCPLATRRVARLESAGAVARVEAYVRSSPQHSAALAQAHTRYARERDRLISPGASPVPAGGVGGNQADGLKCLHAHYADTAAGNANPFGEIIRPFVEPLDCTVPCIVPGERGPGKNPGWQEPR